MTGAFGLMCLLANGAAAALTVWTESWYLLPINVVGILISLFLMTREA